MIAAHEGKLMEEPGDRSLNIDALPLIFFQREIQSE